MKLYELPRNSKFKIEQTGDEVYFFEHIDGMYSVCYTSDDELVHLAAWLEVEEVF